MSSNQENKNHKKPLSHQDVLDMLPQYVLGELESGEMLAVQEYLQTHPELWKQIASMDSTTGSMFQSELDSVPSPDAQEHILQRARASLLDGEDDKGRPYDLTNGFDEEDRADPDKTGSANNVPSTSPPRRSGFPPLNRPAPQRTSEQPMRTQPTPVLLDTPDAKKRPRSRRMTIWKIATISALITAILLSIMTIQLQTTARRLYTQIDTLQQYVSELQSENEALSQNRPSSAAINQPAALALPKVLDRAITLISTIDSNAGGSFFIGEGMAVLIVHGLPILPDVQTYQLWLIPDEEDPVSVGLISIEKSGITTWTDAIPLRADQFTAVGISVEPSGGSQSPSGDMVLLSTGS